MFDAMITSGEQCDILYSVDSFYFGATMSGNHWVVFSENNDRVLKRTFQSSGFYFYEIDGNGDWSLADSFTSNNSNLKSSGAFCDDLVETVLVTGFVNFGDYQQWELFKKVSGSWVFKGGLTGPYDSTYAVSGAVSGDGNYIAIMDYSTSGALTVEIRDSETSIHSYYTPASSGVTSTSNSAVALNENGTRMIVSYDDGTIRVAERSGTTWTTVYSGSGIYPTISPDGNVVQYYNNTTGDTTWVFRYAGSWTETYLASGVIGVDLIIYGELPKMKILGTTLYSFGPGFTIYSFDLSVISGGGTAAQSFIENIPFSPGTVDDIFGMGTDGQHCFVANGLYIDKFQRAIV